MNGWRREKETASTEGRVPSHFAMLCLLALFAVLFIALVISLFRVLPVWMTERNATPQPPPMYGNVMAVTRSPDQPTQQPSLHNGSAGERVFRLQNRLAELGYYTGTVDGQFGPGTEDAVLRFQKEHGLKADGYVGQDTETILYGSSIHTAAPVAPSPAPTATPKPTEAASTVLSKGSKGEEVRRLQERLRALGYLSGTADGQFGNATRDAVKWFQKVNGLKQDGAVGPATAAILYADTAVPAPSPTPVPTPDAGAALPYVRADGLPLLVNKTHPLPEGYQPLQLIVMNDYCDSAVVTIKYRNTTAELPAVDALMTMLRAARADGIKTWQISAAWRSEADQKQIFDKRVRELMNSNNLSRAKAQQAARNTAADPGCSEHHLGTCFDITVPGKSFKGTKQAKWLLAHSWEYGFIQRYPEGKSKITGYTSEAWHYRWVGQPHAEIMHRENLCLEEYIEKYGTNDEEAI
ncbi:MAG: peptidoglycan-binding protein [Clostridia bacterium]|nr:peptidoglycan-binding protein [Clostridia bacterium]